MDYNQVYKEKTIELNQKLKQCKTYNNFKKLLLEMGTLGMGHCLHGKRRGYMAFDFTQVDVFGTPIDSVEYLFDDGVSVGKSKIKNLYKILEVR